MTLTLNTFSIVRSAVTIATLSTFNPCSFARVSACLRSLMSTERPSETRKALHSTDVQTALHRLLTAVPKTARSELAAHFFFPDDADVGPKVVFPCATREFEDVGGLWRGYDEWVEEMFLVGERRLEGWWDWGEGGRCEDGWTYDECCMYTGLFP